MAPEQATSDHVDRRTDVYAASVVLWEILTARRLYTAETEMNLFRAVVEGNVTPPSAVAPELPPEVDALVMRGLARDPAARFATAWEMAEAAQRVAYATPGQVGLWVHELGGAALDARAARVVEIESSERLAPVDDPSTISLVSGDATTLVMLPSGPPPPAPPVPDAQSQITSINVTTTPRRAPRASIALLAAAPVAAVAIAVAALRGPSTAPAAATTAPVASAAPPADSGTAEPVPAAPTASASASADPQAAVPASASVSAKPKARPAPRPNCTPPYRVNEKGVRIPKLECL
jgi:serine/threonine-protein kinase